MSFKILLDPGHYDKRNQSPVVPEYYEGEWTLKYAFVMKAELEKYGFSVAMTRTDANTNPEVYERGKMSKGYDLLISIHSNARDDTTVDRVCVYTQVGDEAYALKSNNIANELAPALNFAMECTGKWKVQARVSDDDRDRDGRLDDDYYGVLHGAAVVKTPAIIVEHSYHTNERAAEFLLDKSNHEPMAVVECDIIADYFGMAGIPGDVDGDGDID